MGTGHGSTNPAERPSGSPARSKALAAGRLILAWVALLWVLEAVDFVTGNALDTFGVQPRRASELVDVVPSAFMHFGFQHLAANTVPLLVLGFLAALRGTGRFLAVALIIIVTSGLGVWLTAPAGSNTAGASGLIFGLFSYLVVRGFVEKRITDLAMGALVAVVYGSLMLGVLPTASGISWQAHLFGLIGGVLAAFVTAGPGRALGGEKPTWH